MTEAKILIVEDDPRVLVIVQDQLEHLGYHVVSARNGIEALKEADEAKPNLIVLDVMMPKMDGYEVCSRLKSNPETTNIPILMLTAKGQLQDRLEGFERGADDYLPKPYDKGEFEARIKALLKRASAPPFPTMQDESTLWLSYQPDRRINIRLAGSGTFQTTTKQVLDLDLEGYARQATKAPYGEWRFNCKQLGKQLYQQLLLAHSEVVTSYNRALGEAGEARKLHLRFESARDFLRVPVEFLFEGLHGDGDYFALRHPLARVVQSIHVQNAPLSPTYLNDLWTKKEPLRVLLVASDTGLIPVADEEIDVLSIRLKELFKKIGISTDINTLPTDQASFEVVRRELKNCRYQIFHYAGHGIYDMQSSEKSFLSFWTESGRRGTIKPMRASELQALVRDSDLRFAYLNCCNGTQTGEPTKLLDDDFLGIADSLVHAGVPAVLGFRWSVSDKGAKTLALAFYESLVKQGAIDTALLDARSEIAARDRDDITWLAPLLILQS